LLSLLGYQLVVLLLVDVSLLLKSWFDVCVEHEYGQDPIDLIPVPWTIRQKYATSDSAVNVSAHRITCTTENTTVENIDNQSRVITCCSVLSVSLPTASSSASPLLPCPISSAKQWLIITINRFNSAYNHASRLLSPEPAHPCQIGRLPRPWKSDNGANPRSLSIPQAPPSSSGSFLIVCRYHRRGTPLPLPALATRPTARHAPARNPGASRLRHCPSAPGRGPSAWNLCRSGLGRHLACARVG